MRSISVLKILQITMGLSGIFIVILGVGYLGSLKGGLTSLLIQNPLWAGMLTGLPLIPLIHSSKQKFTMTCYDRIAHSDFAGTANLISATYELPLTAWLHKTKTVIFQDTAFDQDVALALSWTDDIQSIVWDQGADNENRIENIVEQWDADSIHEFQHSYPVHLFYINNAADDNDKGTTIQETKYGGPGKYMEKGSNLICATATADIGTAPTAGILNYVSEATFIVVAFDKRGSKGEEFAPWVTIVGESAAATDSMFAWPANSNMRITNMRVAIYGGVDVTSQFSFTVDKLAPSYDIGAQASIEMHSKAFLNIMFPLLDSDAAGQVATTAITAYARGPHFLKKGEALQFRHEGVSTYFSIQFQYIPDFGHTAEFRRRFESTSYTSDFTSQWIALFTVPYDMYVTTVKGHIALITDNSESDAYWNLDLMGLKNRNMIDNTDMLLGYSNANVDGNILGATNAAGSLPWTLQSVGISVDATDYASGSGAAETALRDNITAAAKVSYAEAVGDFYPAGSQIGFYFPDDASSNISQLFIEMHVEALNRIKTNKSGTNVLDGYHIVRQEAKMLG